jgi:hypothetical protein
MTVEVEPDACMTDADRARKADEAAHQIKALIGSQDYGHVTGRSAALAKQGGARQG